MDKESLLSLASKNIKYSDNTYFYNTFINCFNDTFDNAVKLINDEPFIITGDIPAMWLRDSTAQVLHYLHFINDDKYKTLIKGLIKKQLKMILIDPYANAFKENENIHGIWDDQVITNSHSSIVWERKFELDSLCYPLFLISKFFEYTKEKDVFDDLFFQTFSQILKVIDIEQNHYSKSNYFFSYKNIDSQKIEVERNSKNKNFSLVWSGFRPSDDICKYHYHIPDNMFLVSVLTKIKDIFKNINIGNEFIPKLNKFIKSINQGIYKYGIVTINGIGKVYVSETDCLGNYSINDDANIPSLLSIPYLEYPYVDNEIYQNTRKFVLSKNNEFFYEGKYLKGIGSPHTPKNMVWPLSIIMQGLTSSDEDEIDNCLNLVLKASNGCAYMHESVDVNNTSVFTREWFGWANSLFAEFCLTKIFKKN